MSRSYANVVSFDENVSYLSTSMKEPVFEWNSYWTESLLLNSLLLNRRLLRILLHDLLFWARKGHSVTQDLKAAVFPVKSRKIKEMKKRWQQENCSFFSFLYLPCLLSPYSARLCALCFLLKKTYFRSDWIQRASAVTVLFWITGATQKEQATTSLRTNLLKVNHAE